MTREERIKIYAFNWWRIRQENKMPGNHITDWEKAEHIVNGEDWAEQMRRKHELAKNDR